MTAQLKLAPTSTYKALTPQTVTGWLEAQPTIAAILGGKAAEWQAREVGDGNLNLVFIVEGPKGSVVAKQALPYVRLVGESWPLPLSRAHYEYYALTEQQAWAPAYVPKTYLHDHDMALTVMEYLTPHIILRKGLVQGKRYPKAAAHLGSFLARTLFHTSDYFLTPVQKREKVAQYLTNTAMCKISEDLIFDEPYYAAPLNRNTPELDDVAAALRADTALKLAVQQLKAGFMNKTEALLHGDLHTGSVMVTEDDTRAIDPEFAFFGPMGFDIGAILANFFMAAFAQEGLETSKGERAAQAAWILEQIEVIWNTFSAEFTALWNQRSSTGELFNARIATPELQAEALANVLKGIEQDALGYAGCKIIRRIVGLAHVEDFEAIADTTRRASAERKAIAFARRLILERSNIGSVSNAVKAAQT